MIFIFFILTSCINSINFTKYKTVGSEQKIKELFKAIENNDVESCRSLIESGANTNCKNSEGKTALTKSIESVNLEICRLLINSGANINEKNTNGTAALHVAVHKCTYMSYILEYVNFLSRGNVIIDEQERQRKIRKYELLDRREIEKIANLIGIFSKKLERDVKRDKLAAFIRKCREISAKYIAIDEQEHQRKIRKYELLDRREIEKISNLIGIFSKKFKRDGKEGELAAFMRKCQKFNAKCLIDSMARQSKKHLQISMRLSQWRKSITCREFYTNYYLKRIEIVNFLLNNSADVNSIEDKSLNTPLHIAAFSGNVDLVNTLLRCRDIDTNMKNKKEELPLDIARDFCDRFSSSELQVSTLNIPIPDLSGVVERISEFSERMISKQK